MSRNNYVDNDGHGYEFGRLDDRVKGTRTRDTGHRPEPGPVFVSDCGGLETDP